MTDVRWTDRSLTIGAFLAIYLIWGSTYLAIRLLSETLPGLSMMGLRFFVAGIALYAWARWRGASRPEPKHWKACAITGGLMLCGGTGGVVVAIRHLDSGLVALLVGMVPLWIALMLWLWPRRSGARRSPPSFSTVGALLIGFVGVAVLAAPGATLEGSPVHVPSLLVTMLACILWGLGSLYSRDAELPSSPHLVSSMQMLTGGVIIVAWGFLDGEWGSFDLSGASAASALAFLYLVVFGSLVAFSAYSWLIRTTEPTLVATYAYVNPVVAIFLGWWLADEPIGARTLVAAALILGSVVLVTTESSRRRRLAAAHPVASECTALQESPSPESPPRETGRVSYDVAVDRSLEKCA